MSGSGTRNRPWLAFVGTGISSALHLTPETQLRIYTADRVFFTVTDPITEQLLRELHPAACSLADLYVDGKNRHDTYAQMTAVVMDSLRAGYNTAVAFYGHPTVLVTTAIDCVRQARLEGFATSIAPGISAESCLYADLCLDPGEYGYQSYEATYLLIYRKQIDITTPLVLWQIGGIGEMSALPGEAARRNVVVLVEYLGRFYSEHHVVAVYEASSRPHESARIQWTQLCDLPSVELSPLSTLFVPPLRPPVLDHMMLNRLQFGD